MAMPSGMLLDLHLSDIPQDAVHLSVEVDDTRCPSIDPAVAARLHDLHKNGLYVSIGQIVALSAIFYRNAVQPSQYGDGQAELKATWAELSNWRPRQEEGRNGIPRLVVEHQDNAGTRAKRCELIGLGVGLLAGIRLYDIDYQFWSITTKNERYDLTATDSASGALVKVEARGRYMRRGWKSAMEQVYKKFAKGDFSKAAGVLFAPRHTANTRAADVAIVDPPGNMPSDDRYAIFRSLLRHYAPFFQRQGSAFEGFARRLKDISISDRRQFEQYLAHGDPDLASTATPRARTFVRVKGNRFVGTAWEGFVWPAHLTGMEEEFREGVFYWGLWEPVVDALAKGDLVSVAHMRVSPVVTRLDHKVLVLLMDGTALAWAPTLNDLSPGMFDGLV